MACYLDSPNRDIMLDEGIDYSLEYDDSWEQRHSYKKRIIDDGVQCDRCTKGRVYFVSDLLDGLSQCGVVEYQNRLRAYSEEEEAYMVAGMKDVDEDEDEDSSEPPMPFLNLCISCQPLYTHVYVPDEHSVWYEGSGSGYDHYYWKFIKRNGLEVQWYLSHQIQKKCKTSRKKIYMFLEERMDIIREDLVKKIFHPERFNKYMNMNYNIVTDEYDYDLDEDKKKSAINAVHQMLKYRSKLLDDRKKKITPNKNRKVSAINAVHHMLKSRSISPIDDRKRKARQTKINRKDV